MTIAANKAVSIEYTLTNDDGDVIDSSAGGAPLVYLQGACSKALTNWKWACSSTLPHRTARCRS